MIVEHTFVTTLEAPNTLNAAGALLRQHGFEAEAESAFQLGAAAWNALEMKRGKTNAARATNALELPQRVRIEWDRGRVIVAAAITPAIGNAWGWGRTSFAASGARSKKSKADQQQLLVNIANALDRHLAGRQTLEVACSEWFQYETNLAARYARTKRRNRIILIIVLVIILGGFGTLLWFASQQR